MIEYYLPRLDASSLTESAFAQKVAHLLKIRQMEAAGQLENVLGKILTGNP